MMVDEDDIDMFSEAIRYCMYYEYTKFPIAWQVAIGEHIITFHIDNYMERYIVLELLQDLEDAMCTFCRKLLVPVNNKYTSIMWNAMRHKFYKILQPIHNYMNADGKIMPQLVIKDEFRKAVANLIIGEP